MAIELAGRKIESAIFDVDGCLYEQRVLNLTFADVRINIGRHLNQVQGIANPTEEQILAMRDEFMTAAEAGSYSGAFVKMGGTLADFKRLADSADRSRYLSFNAELYRMLEYLGSFINIGILTSAPEEITTNTCTAILGTNWRELFDTVICSDSPGVEAEKPDPRVFRLALEQLHASPETTVMIGDTGADMAAAALGMTTIQVERTDLQADAHIPFAEHFLSLVKPIVHQIELGLASPKIQQLLMLILADQTETNPVILTRKVNGRYTLPVFPSKARPSEAVAAKVMSSFVGSPVPADFLFTVDHPYLAFRNGALSRVHPYFAYYREATDKRVPQGWHWRQVTQLPNDIAQGLLPAQVLTGDWSRFLYDNPDKLEQWEVDENDFYEEVLRTAKMVKETAWDLPWFLVDKNVRRYMVRIIASEEDLDRLIARLSPIYGQLENVAV